MLSNFVFCAVIPWVLNCASTWANQTSGSEDQNDGSLRLSAETRGSAAGGSPEVTDIVVHVAVTNYSQLFESQTEFFDIHYISTYHVLQNVLE